MLRFGMNAKERNLSSLQCLNVTKERKLSGLRLEKKGGKKLEFLGNGERGGRLSFDRLNGEGEAVRLELGGGRIGKFIHRPCQRKAYRNCCKEISRAGGSSRRIQRKGELIRNRSESQKEKAFITSHDGSKNAREESKAKKKDEELPLDHRKRRMSSYEKRTLGGKD